MLILSIVMGLQTLTALHPGTQSTFSLYVYGANKHYSYFS